MQTVDHQSIKTGAFIHLIEVNHSLAVTDDLPFRISHWRAILIVEQPFNKIGRWEQVSQTLLILNANCFAPKLLCQAHSSDIGLALTNHLRFRQLLRIVFAKMKGHPGIEQPLISLPGLILRNIDCRMIKR